MPENITEKVQQHKCAWMTDYFGRRDERLRLVWWTTKDWGVYCSSDLPDGWVLCSGLDEPDRVIPLLFCPGCGQSLESPAP